MSIKMVGTLVVKRYLLKTWNNIRQASKRKGRTDITLYTFSFQKVPNYVRQFTKHLVTVQS